MPRTHECEPIVKQLHPDPVSPFAVAVCRRFFPYLLSGTAIALAQGDVIGASAELLGIDRSDMQELHDAWTDHGSTLGVSALEYSGSLKEFYFPKNHGIAFVGMPITLAKIQGWDVQKVYPGSIVAIFPDQLNHDAAYLVVRIRIGWAPHRDITVGPIFGMIDLFNSLEVGTGNVPWALKRSGFFFPVPNGL